MNLTYIMPVDHQRWTISIMQITAHTEWDKHQEIQEVKDAKEKYTNLMNSVKKLSCTCVYKYDCRRTCDSRNIKQQAERTQVYI